MSVLQVFDVRQKISHHPWVWDSHQLVYESEQEVEKEEGNSREVGNYKGQVCLPVVPVPVAVDTTLSENRCNTYTSIFLPNNAA